MDKGNRLFDEKVKQKMHSNDSAFDEPAWALMQQKLDAAGARKVPVFWWLSGVAALLVFTAGMWMFFGDSSVEPANKTPIIVKKGESFSNEGKKNMLGAEEHGERSASPQAGGKNNTGQSVSEESYKLSHLQDDENRLAVSEYLQPLQTLAAVQQSLQVVSAKSVGLAGNDLTIKRPMDLTLDAVYAEADKQTSKQYPQWVFGISAAPDFNAVGSFDEGRVGYSLGATVGFRLTKRLSIQTGLVYAKKTYVASGADYRFRWPTQNISNVYADCDVLDIPLNLSYTVFEKPSTRIKINTGLSSYFMLSEKYDYQRESEHRYYDYKNENRHIMGVLNAGFGIERKLNQKLSLGIRPYVKIPLTGIGAGNVKLISTGVSLQLNINPKK